MAPSNEEVHFLYSAKRSGVAVFLTTHYIVFFFFFFATAVLQKYMKPIKYVWDSPKLSRKSSQLWKRGCLGPFFLLR